MKISKIIVVGVFLVLAFSGCKNTSTALVPEAMNPQEKEVYNALKNIEAGWIEQDFEKVFASYADDGVFTGKKNAQVSKEELVALCNDTQNDWKITAMNIKKLVVEGDKANAETTLKMIAGGNTIDHKENYKLERRNGTWLVVQEMNP